MIEICEFCGIDVAEYGCIDCYKDMQEYKLCEICKKEHIESNAGNKTDIVKLEGFKY